jgi:hypothetical protein
VADGEISSQECPRHEPDARSCACPSDQSRTDTVDMPSDTPAGIGRMWKRDQGHTNPTEYNFTAFIRGTVIGF